MAHTNRAVRVAGTWLAIASVLMVAALVFHGPISPDLNDQMRKIADGAIRWSVVHWIAAAALSLNALTGLVVLTSGSHLTEGWWTMTTAVVEATVVAGAAVSGTKDTFEAWWAFAAGKATGVCLFGAGGRRDRGK